MIFYYLFLIFGFSINKLHSFIISRPPIQSVLAIIFVLFFLSLFLVLLRWFLRRKHNHKSMAKFIATTCWAVCFLEYDKQEEDETYAAYDWILLLIHQMFDLARPWMYLGLCEFLRSVLANTWIINIHYNIPSLCWSVRVGLRLFYKEEKRTHIH